MFSRYFKVFCVSYILIILTKYIFAYYLGFDSLGFSDISYSIFWGYKFDFAASSIVALISILFSFNNSLFKTISSVLVVGLFLTQISDIFYFNESSRHIGYEVTDAITDASSLIATAYTQHTFLTIFSIIFALVLFVVSLKIFDTTSKHKYFVTILISLFVSVFFIRGMAQNIPLNPWQSNQIGDTKKASLALNATYNIIYSLVNKKKKLQPLNLPSTDETSIKQSLKELYNDPTKDISLPIIKTKPNIVFFFLESWSLKYVTPKTTPNYYKILKQSIHPNYIIAGGHRTTEGMFCTLVSYPNPLGKSVAKTQLQNYKYSSIIDILNKNGYNSAFFQGTAKETSGTGSLAQSLGFTKSYGKADVKKRLYKPNTWGIHDVDLYNFVQTTLKEPFVIGINGASTHDDKIPSSIKHIDFTKNEKINKMMNAFHFSDYALGKFISEVENKYPNTIFVLFADHCGGYLSGSLENYQIPFAIYSKQLIQPKFYDTILSQRDIAPTILDLTMGDYKKLASNFTGKSLIQDNKFFANYYHNGLLGWIENKKLVELNIATNKYNCFDINGTKKIKTICNKNFEKLNKHNLDFTTITQKLLFDGKINQFNLLRK